MSGGRLIVLDRAGRDAKQYALAEGLATLGSDLACDIRLMLPAVSPHHATVMVQANQTVIQSVSEGVTLLNDVPVSVAVLRHGDIISVGGRALRWEYSQRQHRNLSKAQPALVAVNKTRGRGKSHRSRSSDPVFHNTPVHNGRASMPASIMKQVAIVQPQRRDVMQGEPNCTPELTGSSQVENTENESTQETIKRKSARPSQKSLQANTKASEWIESRKSSSRPPITPSRTRNTLTPSDLQPRSKSVTRPSQRETQLRSKSLVFIPLKTKVEKTRATLTPKQTQLRSKPIEKTPIRENKSATRVTLTPKETREVRSRSLADTPVDAKVESISRTETRESRKSTLIPIESKSVTQLTITPTEAHETTRSSILVERQSAFTPLNRSKSLIPRPTPLKAQDSSKSRILSRSRLTSTPIRTLSKSSNRPTLTPLPEKRVLPPRARTLTPRAQAYVTNKSSIAPLRTWRDTSLRSTVLRKTHRPIKIQAPTLIDHTKQAAIMLMTRHTKSKSPNAVSIVVTKPSPVRKSLKRSSPSPRENLARKLSTSVLNKTDELSTRRSVSCPSARKSAMKSTLKDPRSARKIESIKFDLSNLENDTKSDRFRSSVVTVDTTNQSFDSVSSLQHSSMSPRRSIHSRSSRIMEKTLGSPMTLVETTETSITTSPRSRSSRGSLIVQKALEETKKTQSNNISGQTNLTKTLSPRGETYSIVDLVSSNATEYNTIDSTPFGTPRSHRKSRSFDAALPSSTPYKEPRNHSLQDESVSGHVESPEIITPQNNENNKPVASTKVSKRSRSKSRLNDSDLFLLEDEDSPRTSKRADKSATTSFDISHLKRKLSQSLTESDEESDKSEINVFAKAPKNSLSIVRVKELFAKSPQNDLRSVSGVKTLFKSIRKQKTPKNTLEDVRGVKRLFREKEKTPKNTLENVSGIKALFRRSPRNDLRVSGVKDALHVRSPKNDLTDVRGVRHLYRLEKERYSSNVSGIQEIFKENSDLDTTFDLLMGKPQLRTYKAASAQKMKLKQKTRKAKSLYDSTVIHPEEWLKKKVITVYNEKNLPLKKRSFKTVKSTPVKANVTLNSTELCQISPITKPAPVNTVGLSQLDDRTIDISVNNSSTSLGRTTGPSRQTRSMLKTSTFTIKDIISEENISLVIHKKAPVVKSVRKTRQRRVLEEPESTQNKEILEPKDQKVTETKTTRQKVKTFEQETASTSVPRTTRSKAKSPKKSLAKRVSIVIKTPVPRITRKAKITVKEQNENVKNSKVRPTQNKEIPTIKGKARVLTKQTPKRSRTRRVSIVIPAKTPVASVKKTRSRVAAAKETAQKKAAQDTVPTKTTRKGKTVEVKPAENQGIEKPKRGRKIQVGEKNPEVEVKNRIEVKTRAKVIVKPDTIKIEKKTQAKGKKEVTTAQEPMIPPKTSRKRKSPDTTPAGNEDIEKPKRGRKNPVEKKAPVTAATKQSEVKTRAKANIQASSSKGDNKIAQSKGKKVAPAQETVAPSTSRKRKSLDVTSAKEDTSVATKRRKATEVTAPSRVTRSKAVSESQPKPRGRKR